MSASASRKSRPLAPDAAFWPLSFAHHPFGVVSNALQPVQTAYTSMPGLAHTKYTVIIQKRPFAAGAPCTDLTLEGHLMDTLRVSSERAQRSLVVLCQTVASRGCCHQARPFRLQAVRTLQRSVPRAKKVHEQMGGGVLVALIHNRAAPCDKGEKTDTQCTAFARKRNVVPGPCCVWFFDGGCVRSVAVRVSMVMV